MSLEDELRKRFETAVREGIRPGVLYGPKWLHADPEAGPDHFIFVGTPKIVKASGRDLDRVLLFLEQGLDLSGLGMEYSVDEKGYFHVRPSQGKSDAAAPPTAGQATKAAPPARKKPAGQ